MTEDWAKLATVAVLAAACVARLIYLEADPPFLASRDFISDELWWSLNARNQYLFGQWQSDQYNMGLASPAFSLMQLAAFRLFGLSLASLRIGSALAGILACVAVAVLARAHWSWRRTAIATAFFSLSQLDVFYSRLAYADAAMIAPLLWALVLWDRRRTYGWAAFASGFAFGVTLAVKSAAMLLLPAITVLIAVEWWMGEARRRDVTAVLAGTLLVICIVIVTVILPHLAEWRYLQGIGGVSAGPSWSVTGPFHFTFNSFFRSEPVLTLLALAGLAQAWASRGWLRQPLTRRAIVLLAGYSAPVAFLSYQPERRLLPLLFPLAVLATRAVTTNDGSRSSRAAAITALMIAATIAFICGPEGWLAVAANFCDLETTRALFTSRAVQVATAAAALAAAAACMVARAHRVGTIVVRYGFVAFVMFDLTIVGAALAFPAFSLRAAIDRLAAEVPAGPNLIGVTPALKTRGPIITYLPHVGINADAMTRHPGAWMAFKRVDDGREQTDPWTPPPASLLRDTIALCPFGIPPRPRFVFELWQLPVP